MTDKLKVLSPYDGHLIKEIDLDDEIYSVTLPKHFGRYSFWEFLEKASGAKWRYLGVVYRYGFSTRITLIWNLIPKLALGLGTRNFPHPPGLCTTLALRCFQNHPKPPSHIEVRGNTHGYTHA